MILKSLRYKIGYISNGLQRAADCSKTWKKLSEVSSIIVFANIDSPESIDAFNHLRKQMKQTCQNAKLASILFVEKEKLTDFTAISDYDKEYISKETFGFFFKLKDNDLVERISTAYDLAINLCEAQNNYLDFLFPCVKSAVKVGRSGIRDEQLNFMIDSTSSPRELGNNIVENLKMMFN